MFILYHGENQLYETKEDIPNFRLGLDDCLINILMVILRIKYSTNMHNPFLILNYRELI